MLANGEFSVILTVTLVESIFFRIFFYFHLRIFYRVRWRRVIAISFAGLFLMRLSLAMNTDSISELLEHAQEQYEGPLTGYAAGLLGGDWDRAKDVVQDVFVKLYRQDPDPLRGRLRSWLYTVCRNRSIDIIRKEKPMHVTEVSTFESMDSPEGDPSEAIQTSERHAEVLSFLSKLPENQREVIRLKYQGDLSYKEISEVTGLSVSNVGFLMHTGIKRMRSMMGVNNDSED